MATLGSLLLAVSLASGFWSHWGDGKAELSSYTIEQNRYGEMRKAEGVLIYVTEPFNLTKQVKADYDDKNDPNVVSLLKLNRVKKFQTGIYDYSLMSSVFVPLESYTAGGQSHPAGHPLKVTFTSQEWCGMAFEQLNRTDKGMRSRSFSYFESEGDADRLLVDDKRTYYADELFIAVRELIRPMASGSIFLYQTLEAGRLHHRSPERMEATVSRSEGMYSYGGRVEVNNWSIKAGKYAWTFTVEQAFPHKILAYSYSEGNTLVEKGTLKKSVRLPYWELNANRDETYLKKLGL